MAGVVVSAAKDQLALDLRSDHQRVVDAIRKENQERMKAKGREIARTEQEKQAKRVGSRIDRLVFAFCRGIYRQERTIMHDGEAVRRAFFGAQLLAFVEERVEKVAPDSPRRRMKALCERGDLRVALVSRSRSLYRVVGVRGE